MIGMDRENLLDEQAADIASLRAELERALRSVQLSSNARETKLRSENERLRAALAVYADENYNGRNGGPEHAQAALRDVK
jgi:K+-sensing histidine kinase KdpD